MSLNLREKKILAMLFVLFVLALILRIYQLVILKKPEVPVYGGTYKEISFGEVTNFNPFFATSRAEKDVSRILFLNLVDFNDKGEIKGTLLDKFDLLGTEGQIVFKKNLYWHDGEPVTMDDFIFTVNAFKKVKALSLWGQNWEKIEIKKVSKEKAVLTYPEGALSAKILRFPVLPSHLLSDKDVTKIQGFNFNLNPVGNGPYKFRNIQRLNTGEIVVNLDQFNKFPEKSYLASIQITVEPSIGLAFSKYKTSPFSGLAQMPLEEAMKFKDRKAILRYIELPQYTAIFYNLKNQKLQDLETRKELDQSIDRRKIYQELSLVKPTALPLPAGAKEIKTYFKLNETKKILAPKKLNLELAFVDQFIYRKTAENLANTWDKAGVKIKLVPMDEYSLSQKLITKNFDLVLWGETIGQDWLLDRWYSSSNLNFSSFVSAEVDSQLAQVASKDAKIAIAELIRDSYPASFLYSVPYIWSSRNLKGASLSLPGEEPTDRFKELTKWYLSVPK